MHLFMCVYKQVSPSSCIMFVHVNAFQDKRSKAGLLGRGVCRHTHMDTHIPLNHSHMPHSKGNICLVCSHDNKKGISPLRNPRSTTTLLPHAHTRDDKHHGLKIVLLTVTDRMKHLPKHTPPTRPLPTTHIAEATCVVLEVFGCFSYIILLCVAWGGLTFPPLKHNTLIGQTHSCTPPTLNGQTSTLLFSIHGEEYVSIYAQGTSSGRTFQNILKTLMRGATNSQVAANGKIKISLTRWSDI